MRGQRDPQGTMLALVNLEERAPKDHPLRTIKAVADQALERLSGEFDGMYSDVGRASVPPERLLKASLLICLYSVRSERAFCEELEYNLLFRWFLDMNLTEHSFAPTVFTKNRRRLLEHRTAQALFDEVVLEAARRGLLSDEHFSVDGMLIEAMASIKSFRKRDEDDSPPDDDPRNRWVDFRGEKLRNETHRSRTDPEARLMRKGREGRPGCHSWARADGERQRAADGLRGEQGDGHGGARRGAGDAGRCPAERLPSRELGG